MLLLTHLILSSVATGLPVYDAVKLLDRFDVSAAAHHIINDAGDIVGIVTYADGRRRPALFRNKSTIIDLGLPATTRDECTYVAAEAFAINNLGTVVGQAHGSCPSRPVVWSHGTATILPGLGGLAFGVNDSDVVVGNDSDSRSWVYDHGSIEWLLPYETPGATFAADINASGQITGSTSLKAGGHNYPAVWDHGSIHVRTQSSCNGLAINDVGQVVGECFVTSASQPFVWQWQENTFSFLDIRRVLGARGAGEARDINNHGEVTGLMWAQDFSSPRAFFWNGGIVRSLNALTPELDPYLVNHGLAINEGGEIAGYARESDRFGVHYDKAIKWEQTGHVWK